jgi:hypothetical protein
VTDLDEMWARLERHQPFADERGHGDAWRKMCEERTPEAAKNAAFGCVYAGAMDAAGFAAMDAAWAAGNAARAGAAVAWFAKIAIRNINESEEK